MERFQNAACSRVLLEAEPQAAKLELRFEPQALVFGLGQAFQGCGVELLQQLHVGAVPYEVQQAVDLLLALVARHSRLDVLQHFPAESHLHLAHGHTFSPQALPCWAVFLFHC